MGRFAREIPAAATAGARSGGTVGDALAGRAEVARLATVAAGSTILRVGAWVDAHGAASDRRWGALDDFGRIGGSRIRQASLYEE
jgi:hypothetical protein